MDPNMTRAVPKSFYFVQLYLGIPFLHSFRPYITMLYMRSEDETRWLYDNSSIDSLIGSEGG